MIPALRARLNRGEPCLVLNVDHPAPSLVERLGRLAAVDALFLDCEQGSADVETIENMARAARLAGKPSLVRLFDRHDWVIERYMGRGVDGIVIPRLRTPGEARAVVEAVRYCFPNGADEKLVVIQIETESALSALAEFVAIDGIDVLFLGPVDLAKSLGFHGQHRGAEMQRILRDAVSRIVAGERAAGILVDRDDAGEWARCGATFLYDHADNLLATGAADFRSRLTSAPPLRQTI